MKTNYVISKILPKLGISILGLLMSQLSFSQLVERPNMTFKGRYDVKMVAAPVLQAVWVKTQNPLQILRPLTDLEMNACGKYLSINNEVSGGTGTNSVFLKGSMNSNTYPFIPTDAIGIAMVYADCDDDMTTFQSSAAYLDLGTTCNSVSSAYLYWMGNNEPSTTTYAAYPGLETMESHSGGATGNVTGYNTVKFRGPGEGSYTTVTASRTLNNSGVYVCFADVTNLVVGKPSGLYWLANVKNSGIDDASGAKGGWNLVVVHKSDNKKTRVIKFWDGFLGSAGGNSVQMDFALGELPVISNKVSYLGFCSIDAEDNAGIIADNGITTTVKNSGLRFIDINFTTSTQDTVYVNPLITDQPGVTATTSAGDVVSDIHEAMTCSRLTTYDPLKGTSGNELIRVPKQINTLGFGAHHIKLPESALPAGTQAVKLDFLHELNGGYSMYMAYMAIEVENNGPVLDLKKSVQANDVAPSDEVTYHLFVTNVGKSASISGAYIVDTLDLPIDYVPGSAAYITKNGVGFTPPSPVEVFGQDTDSEILKFYLPSIGAVNANGDIQDSILISFRAKVKGLDRTDIWQTANTRTVKNIATLYYETFGGIIDYTISNALSICDSPTYVTFDVDVPLGLDNKNASSVFLSPNPANDYFQVSGIEGKATVTITDLSGKLLFAKEIYAKENIAVDALEQGVYIVKVTSDSGSLDKKLVKK